MNQQHATLTKTTVHACITGYLQVVVVCSAEDQPNSHTEKSPETILSKGSIWAVANQKIFISSLSLSIQKKE